MKRGLAVLAVVLMAGSTAWMARLLWGGAEMELPPAAAVSPQALHALQATALPDATGRMQPLNQWRGRVLVVNWWATWCTPCRDEMPVFSQLQTRYASRGVQFVGIAADGAEKVTAHLREMPSAYPLLVGGEEAIRQTRDLGNAPLGVPFTLVIDRDGRPRAAILGRVPERALAKLLDRLI